MNAFFHSRGFSLIEIIFALSIATILLILLVPFAKEFPSAMLKDSSDLAKNPLIKSAKPSPHLADTNETKSPKVLD